MKEVMITITTEAGEKVLKLDDYSRIVLQNSIEGSIEAYDEANENFGDEDDMIEIPEILRILAKEL